MDKRIRLINFVVDTFLYLIFLFAFLSLSRNFIPQEEAKWVSMGMYFLYYFLFEFFTRQTPGKMITKSKVESLSGNQQYWIIRIAARSLMRFIPIDIISYLFSFRGLHDRISKTTITKA